MSEFNRLSESTEWIGLEFVERQRTPEFAIQVGIQLHLAGLSLSNTKQYLERLGVERSRTAIHDWVRKADLQPNSDVDPNQITVDETAIRINGQRHWLYAAVDSDTNQSLHVRLFQTRTTRLTMLFLRQLRDKQQVNDVTFLIDDAAHLIWSCVNIYRFRSNDE
jgi:putative transposase